MYKGQYDTDVSVWSPQGRLLQVEYANEAVKQGSISLALSNSKYVVFAALKRSPGALSGFQKKMYSVDDHCGMCISGLNSDARIIWEAAKERDQFDRPISIEKLCSLLADKAQKSTQVYGGRPFGSSGASLWEISPSGSVESYYAIAIGARSQPARTYLEQKLDEIRSSTTADPLISHAIKALSASMPPDTPLKNSMISLALVGPDESFHILSENEISALFEDITSPSQNIEVMDI